MQSNTYTVQKKCLWLFGGWALPGPTRGANVLHQSTRHLSGRNEEERRWPVSENKSGRATLVWRRQISFDWRRRIWRAPDTSQSELPNMIAFYTWRRKFVILSYKIFSGFRVVTIIELFNNSVAYWTTMFINMTAISEISAVNKLMKQDKPSSRSWWVRHSHQHTLSDNTGSLECHNTGHHTADYSWASWLHTTINHHTRWSIIPHDSCMIII